MYCEAVLGASAWFRSSSERTSDATAASSMCECGPDAAKALFIAERMERQLKIPAARATSLYMTSVCLLLVWKNASGLSWKFSPHSCCCSLLLPARVCTWFTRLPAVLSSAGSRNLLGSCSATRLRTVFSTNLRMCKRWLFERLERVSGMAAGHYLCAAQPRQGLAPRASASAPRSA